MKLPPHESTTAQLAAAHPFAASEPLPAGGVVVGRDLLGGIFVHDPFELYANGALTNPNAVVLGQIGRGKSSLVKSYLYRQAAFGRRVVVLDPKGEYGALAAALGARSLCLHPGGSLRVNPLDPPARGRRGAADVACRRLELLGALAASCLARPLAPLEHAALELALARAGRLASVPVLPSVVDALLGPEASDAAALGLGDSELRQATRDLTLALRRLVHGELSGMFDGPTSREVRVDGPVLVLDLAAVYRSSALGAVMACAAAFLDSLAVGPSQRLLVVDEAWAVLSDPAAARFLQASWKLARSSGTANLAVVHRLSDLATAGAAGSVSARIAEGLLADSETVVCFGMAPGEADACATALALGPAESALLARLPRATALWKVGGRCYLVEHRLSAAERAIVDTDAALLGPAGANR